MLFRKIIHCNCLLGHFLRQGRAVVNITYHSDLKQVKYRLCSRVRRPLDKSLLAGGDKLVELY